MAIMFLFYLYLFKLRFSYTNITGRKSMKTLDFRVSYTVYACSKVKIAESAELIMNSPQNFFASVKCIWISISVSVL